MRHREASSLSSRLGHGVLTIVLLTAMCASLVTLGSTAAGADGSPTIASDKTDYPPGAAVQLTGSGWQAGESVEIVVNDTDGQTWQRDVTVTADENGAISDTFDLPAYFIANYDVTATGAVSGVATTTFTDLPIGTFDQCQNDQGTGYTSGDLGCQWTNGALNSTNSTYFEGDSTVQRLWLIKLEPNSSHTVTISYDTTRGGKHGYDYLTTWDASENWVTPADRCQDITGCDAASTESKLDIGDDPNVPNTIEPTAPGARQFVMRGGSLDSATNPAITAGTYASNSTTSITISFTVGPDSGAMCENTGNQQHPHITCGVALWFGAHLAKQSDWGLGLGSSNISGAPFHVSLAAFEDGSIGGRDNGIQGNNIGVNGSLVLAKNLTGAPNGYTGPFTIHYDCGAFGSDDVSVSAGSSVSVPGIPNGTTCTVTEPNLPTPPTGYSFGTPSFTDSSGTADDGVVTIVGGASVTVTTNNSLTRDTGSLVLAKSLSGGPNGYTGPFTIHYDCGAFGADDVSVSAGGSQTVPGIPTGTTCTVTEPNLPSPPTGYTFGTPSFTDSSGTANDGVVTIDTTSSVTVTTNNTLTRDTGTLTIKKMLSNPDGASVPSSYSVSYNCGVGFTGTRSISPGTSGTVTGIPTGNTCSVTETTPAAITGFTWAAPTYSAQPVTITTAGATITVNNAITRDRGTLTIKKTLSNPDGATVPSSYSVSYNCGTGYTGTRSVSPSASGTVTGIPTGNTCSVSEAALAPIAGFAWAAPTYSAQPVTITTAGATITVNNSIRRDNTPPACALTQTIAGPPTQIKVTVSDSSSGLKSIIATKANNTSVSIPAFSVGTTSAIVVTGTKINQSLNSEMALQVTDVAGNVTNCDPVIVNALGTTKSVSVNVPTAEHFVTVYNGNPGISSVTIKVNGTQFVMTNLKAGETRNLDISAALLPGDQNTITLTAAGSAKGTAIVQIWDGV